MEAFPEDLLDGRSMLVFPYDLDRLFPWLDRTSDLRMLEFPEDLPRISCPDLFSDRFRSYCLSDLPVLRLDCMLPLLGELLVLERWYTLPLSRLVPDDPS